MDAFTTQYQREVTKRIGEEANKRISDNGRGYAVTLEQYKLNGGFIQGLELALEICEEVQKSMTEAERK